MPKDIRVASINVPFVDSRVVDESIDSATALFDFDVVVIRPPAFTSPSVSEGVLASLSTMMMTKNSEIHSLLAQGGVLVIFLDVPDFCSATVYEKWGKTQRTVSNYDFVDTNFANFLVKGSGTQITYTDPSERFVEVLKNSDVAWTTYLRRQPDGYVLNSLKAFATAGAGGYVAAKTAYREGHIILLPMVTILDEDSFFEACIDYRFKRQGSRPPDWIEKASVPGLKPIKDEIADVEKKIAMLEGEKQQYQQKFEERAAYRKLLYEKGKSQLEPIVLRALDDLEFNTSPSELIPGTIHEIDGRTKNGSSPGIVEAKGSKNAISQTEFAVFPPKILADAEVSKKYSKGVLVGNGFCEKPPTDRLGEVVFTAHALDGAKRMSVALINSVELYWLCCTMLEGSTVDKATVREKILTTNGYVDLKPFCSATFPFASE